MSFGDRRTPLKRTGFTAKAPVNTDRKPRAAVRFRAPKRAPEERAYANLRVEMLATVDGVAPACEAGLVLLLEGVRVCTGTATELHHLRKRSSSGALANPANVRRLCHACNMAVEDHPVEARRAGLVVREGDPTWDELGARAWRERA